jgi:hypothetical protein
MELLRKITMKGIGWDKGNILELVLPYKDDPKPVPIARIFGVMTDTKTYVDANTGDTGEGLKGQFEATNIKTGEVYTAPVCYLPGAAMDMITAAFSMAKEQDASSTVKFAFDVFAKYDSTAATSYTFGVKPLVEANKIDPLAELREASGNLPALPAPSKAKKGDAA